MSSSPSLELWYAAETTPFSPIIGKSLHAPVAFFLLAIGSLLTIIFSINKSLALASVIAIPASIAFGIGSVYAMAAGGVYV
ncbi:hypothetical protein H072_3499 [Dactylellina haptotyla CBS 200.50]|uniref:Dolichyl-diphosphooligosaccharide-protein glycosyltransferase subunit OST5 n=1 Tax=Dactylellina haptotyla (strain CBS 200.50) TaxID=1284197 RepID=S8AN17_DACHA|nr:hypothetical protein H072_3499 [Dactylellina haptotyla CBS 200.50]